MRLSCLPLSEELGEYRAEDGETLLHSFLRPCKSSAEVVETLSLVSHTISSDRDGRSPLRCHFPLP
jgi:hypothetical protein